MPKIVKLNANPGIQMLEFTDRGGRKLYINAAKIETMTRGDFSAHTEGPMSSDSGTRILCGVGEFKVLETPEEVMAKINALSFVPME